MDTLSFTYHGIEYQVDKVVELEPEAGKKNIQIITKDNRQFKLTFQESIFRWIVSEAAD